ncbi:MAG: hypothetical protein OFPII_21310 [Osedax symbiont Rs1]|nr:MAG: hypothetical protein OFPII_21310 [Osedax symbiont Rs1]
MPENCLSRWSSLRSLGYAEASASCLSQRGAVLIVGLIFLVLMSIMGLTAMQNVTLQERITGNTLDRFKATQEAEIALLIAEKKVEEAGFEAANSDFLYTGTDITRYQDKQYWESCEGSDYITTGSDKRFNCTVLGNANVATKYQKVADQTYLITVRGKGQGEAQVILQTKYGFISN